MGKFELGMPLSLKDVRINGKFWDGILDTVRNVMIPYQWDALNDCVEGAEKSHCLMNFRIAAGDAKGEFGGLVFQDSDLAKWLEAVGYSLETHPDRKLERKADEAIDLIVRAQREDGYINTYFILEEPEKRWTNLLECHELYCAGHLIEAAVAYYHGTGKREFLDAMMKYADYIGSVFGLEPGKLKGYPGHPEIELALVKLYRATGEERYLRLVQFFVDERGRQSLYFDQEWEKRGRISHWTKQATEEPNRWYNQNGYREYNQFHLPVREQAEAVGHAVRAAYLYEGMADVAAETGDAGLLKACRRLWADIVNRKLYITGGIGSTPQGEAFTAAYDLPNDTVYAEACASIAMIFFSHRMLMLDADGRYAGSHRKNAV